MQTTAIQTVQACSSNAWPLIWVPDLSRDHKGSGLAFVLEVLSGALVGAAVEDKQNARNWGCLVAAIDPAAFGSPEGFTERVQQLAARVKGARKEPGVRQVLLPGERGYAEAGVPLMQTREAGVMLACYA